MVKHQIRHRGIDNPDLIRALLDVPREQFVALPDKKYAYEDRPLPIEAGQTISQPFIVALMIAEGLRKTPGRDKALEVGSGSGYATAILSKLFNVVYAVERLPILVHSSQNRLKDLQIHNAHIKEADGSVGWQEHAPYDMILVSAAAPQVPQSLCAQLKQGGALILPVGDSFEQKLIKIIRLGEHHWEQDVGEAVRFVPLIGKEGWKS